MIRIHDGYLEKGDKILMMQTGASYIIDKVAVLKPEMEEIERLSPGEIGV